VAATTAFLAMSGWGGRSGDRTPDAQRGGLVVFEALEAAYTGIIKKG